MKYILVLEDDQLIKKELLDTLKSIDSQLQIRVFETLASFHEWMKVVMTKGILALPEEHGIANADDEVRLVIAKNELLGTHNMDLIRHTREFFTRKKLCSAEVPTGFILTVFDSPDFHLLEAEDEIISNVLFKPFDKLILKQHLEFAIGGRQPLDGSTISAIEVSDKVEMLKRATFSDLSEIGFTTLSSVQIPVGTITKYYADVFQADERKSVYASCASSVEKAANEFSNEFHFFGAENAQIQKIRTHILHSNTLDNKPIVKPAGAAFNMLIVSDNAHLTQELKNLFQDKFSQVNVFAYASQEQLQVNLNSIPVEIDGFFADYEFFEFDKEKKWDFFCAALQEEAKKRGVTLDKNPALFVLSKKKIPPEALRDLSSFAKDIFFLPTDKIYCTKKISAFFDKLALLKSLSLASSHEEGQMKIAASADIKQISEAGLVMTYHRQIEIGAFREFILLRTSEHESPEITGMCNYTIEQKDGKTVTASNHFIFFGMRDHYLKHIRLWIRDTYIRNKGEEG